MTPTLVFPDELMAEVKHEAIRQHRKLKDLVADLIRLGLDAQRRAPAAEAQCREEAAVWLTEWKSLGSRIESKKHKGESLVVRLEADRGSRG